jgi:hypothetical protein
MPSYDGVRLDQHQGRAPVPPGVGQQNPEHPVNGPELRTLGAASHRVQLLSERNVLKDQFVMPTARQSERSDEKENHLQHATDRVMRRDENQPVSRRMRFWRKTGVCGHGHFVGRLRGSGWASGARGARINLLVSTSAISSSRQTWHR